MTTTVTVQRPSKTGGSSRSKDRRSKKSQPADAASEAQSESQSSAAPRTRTAIGRECEWRRHASRGYAGPDYRAFCVGRRNRGRSRGCAATHVRCVLAVDA